MINILQAGRFFAAMAVVIHHSAISVAAFVSPMPDMIFAGLSYGYLGVDFFFALSGFIIHYSLARSPRSPGQFAFGRLTRIMLPYWPVGFALALAYSAAPALSAGDRSWGWLSTLTLLPTDQPPALSVAWTLQHELLFYLLYAALFFSGRLWVGLILWAAAIGIGSLFGLPDAPVLRVLLAPVNIEFIAGVAAAGLFVRARHVPAAPSVGLAALLLATFILMGGHRPESWLVGLSIAALLPWLCSLEKAGSVTVPAWLVWGGAASYAIYLTHNPLLSLTSRLLASIGVSWPVGLAASIFICLAAGAVYFGLWERRVMRLFRRVHRSQEDHPLDHRGRRDGRPVSQTK